MAIKEQCLACKEYNPDNGLCTKLWTMPTWDSTECNSNKDPNTASVPESYQEERRPKEGKFIGKCSVITKYHDRPKDFVEMQIEGENIAYQKSGSFTINYYLMCSLIALFTLPLLIFSIYFLIKGEIMFFLMLLIGSAVMGLCFWFPLKKIRRHKYDSIYVTSKMLWLIIENTCHGIPLGYLKRCDLDFAVNRRDGGKTELHILLKDGSAQTFDVTNAGVNISAFADAINTSAGANIIDKKTVKYKRWREILVVVTLSLIYIIVRVYLRHN